MEPIVIWDLDDDPDGNLAHIAEHGVTREEVEDVLQNEDNETDVSASSGRPITFGWTRTGKHLAVSGKRRATTRGWSTRSRPTKPRHVGGEPMANSIQQKTDRSPEEVARLRELRERYQREKPSIADLEARGAEFATLGEVVLLRCLADELRRERERQGLPREKLAERLHLDDDALADIEAGTVGGLTLGMLSRIAHALGKQVVCSLVEKAA